MLLSIHALKVKRHATHTGIYVKNLTEAGRKGCGDLGLIV